MYEQHLRSSSQRSDEQQRIEIKQQHDVGMKGIAMLGHAT
jgi:hypothetical protein